MSSYSAPPDVGSQWSSDDYLVRVIDAADYKNLNEDGTHKKSGMVVYEYLSEPVGKIGSCQSVIGFYKCFPRPV